MDFLEKAKAIEDQIIAWRRAIHANPELGFEEHKTASLVLEALRDMGIEAQAGVGRTGVVARIGNGDGRKIGIRADMDALPLDEAVDLPFKSTVAGKMHACGHDAHTAMLLGVAKILHDMPDINGEIRLLFQPSEERWGADGISGATAMISDNALEELDAVIAVHVDSMTPVGEITVSDGNASAAADMFYATIKGIGCHGASPHTGVDPIWIAAQVINAVQAIRSRRTDPTTGSVISMGAIHGGSAPNIIPAEVTINGTIRTFDEDIRNQIHEELDKAFQIARTLGGDYELNISKGYPPMWNDPSIAQLLRDVSAGILGAENAQEGKPGMFGEDFAYMQKKAPGAMLSLGARYDDQHRPHHSPIFALGEDSFKYGTAIMAESAVRLLKQDS
ncbi:MAG: amidohydrolase [Anaerolineae bacterium]|nr:amidohydrolase [Anaerolineae bacterium]